MDLNILSKQFAIDVCLGIGAKYKQIQYKSNDPSNKNPDYSWSSSHYFSPNIDPEGDYWEPNIPLNIKLVTVLGKSLILSIIKD